MKITPDIFHKEIKPLVVEISKSINKDLSGKFTTQYLEYSNCLFCFDGQYEIDIRLVTDEQMRSLLYWSGGLLRPLTFKAYRKQAFIKKVTEYMKSYEERCRIARKLIQKTILAAKQHIKLLPNVSDKSVVNLKNQLTESIQQQNDLLKGRKRVKLT